MVTLFIAIVHCGARQALTKPEVGDKRFADTNSRRYIAKDQGFVYLSESQGYKLVVGSIFATSFVGFMLIGETRVHPAKYKVDNLMDERLVRIFGSPEQSHKK